MEKAFSLSAILSAGTSSPGGRWFPMNAHEALVRGNSVRLVSASSKPRPRGTKFLTLRSTLAHSPVLDAIVEQAENNQAWKFTETMAFSQSESPVRKMMPSLFFCFSILQKGRHCDAHQPTFPGKNETTFGCDQDTPPSHPFL